MINEQELSKLALESKKHKNKVRDKKSEDRNIAEWQIFYLNNLDIFTEDFLEIPLHYFQKQILLQAWEADVDDVVASRGLSKSFTIANLANDLALLLPGIQIAVTAMTLGQANKILNDKIGELLCGDKKGISPVLKQMRKEGYIKFGKDDTGNGAVVTYGNGSKIFSVLCGEGGRCNRSNITITDEAALIKKKDYDAIIEPTLEPYNFNGLFFEPKQIFMTSARTKDNWFYTHLINTVNQHYINKKAKYNFFAGDIFVAVANKIQTKKQYEMRKKNTDDLTFEEEYMNLWLGEKEGSLYKYDDFHKAQVLEKAFHIRNSLEYLEQKEIKYDFKDDEIRWLTMDIAVAGGRENDNTAFLLGKINQSTLKRSVENVSTENGMNSLKQVVLLKRMFYEYKCSYFVYDTTGVGNALYDSLTIETYDEERSVTYPAWNVCTDKKLQIVSDNVLNDKINRTITSNGEEVIIPIVGTSTLNSEMFLALRKNLQDGVIDFLKDDTEMELILSEDSRWLLKSSEERADSILPFMQTRYMVNESISLDTEISNNVVKVKEKRSATKDRFMALVYFNYFSNKLANKYSQEDDYDDEDFDASAWSFLGDVCKV